MHYTEQASGQVRKYSVRLPEEVAEKARARSGDSGLSAYVTAAVARQIRRDRLDELIAACEAVNGPVDQAAVEAKLAIFDEAEGAHGAGGSTPRPAVRNGTLVLDREGLEKAALRDFDIHQWLAAARLRDKEIVVSAATLVGVARSDITWPALQWTLSRITVEPVTGSHARHASALLFEARRHGHEDAFNALLCATALVAARPVLVLASDPEDVRALCGDRVSAAKI